MKLLILLIFVFCSGCGHNTPEPINATLNEGGPQNTVAIVQFCPGFTPSYPNTFPESGICIDNQLYGVYSANGGFLTLLSPGVYTSDGINASCTFTVEENCLVAQ